ncbi:cytochrome d ubiquinol oxidase subunit II, partial [Limosilactobacillus fermentum]|nr:cytochrome d ubiquinol oxidase subunit II [Limosilactobacillus fermentum]
MSALQLVWVILIAVLFSGFFLLVRFDSGVGMVVTTLATNDEGRRPV